MQWTKAQKNAIECLDGTLIVSAAAGSGKTSVLVERVINRLTDTQNTCDANRLLIVTFTRAATSEMRERIDKAISKKLKDDPQNPHLLRQKMLLPSANICTIDSFCNDIVKENFFKLGINPDFKIISESERKLIAQETVNEVIEDFYKQNSNEFKELVEFLFKGRDDNELAKCIIELYDYSQAYAFPQKWLDDSLAIYNDSDDIKSNKFLCVLFDYISNALDYIIERYNYCLELIEQDEVLKDKYLEFFKTELKMINSLKSHCENKDWDMLYEAINKPKMFPTIPRLPKGYTNELKDTIKSTRDDIKKKIDKKIKPIVCCNTTDFVDDLKYLKPIVSKLFESVSDFSKRFIAKKQDQNSLDFSDITHLAINLLIEEKNGKYEITTLAKEMSEKYTEILIDEYQDTNKAQDILFSSISKDSNNLFMVGDVKQSIYRFRKAMPEIFIEKRNSFNDFEKDNYPGVINLDKNYRSRKGVVSFINFIFSQIMSDDVGEVCYNDAEELKFGASYQDKKEPDTEIHLIDTTEIDKNEQSSEQLEAKHIAKYISQAIDNGAQVQNKDGTMRNATYKDFCILLRSTKTKSQIYAKELLAQGIPAFGENAGGFFDTYEVQVIVSLLKVLDNPVNDIPLLSVLMSPIFGFSPDDIATIRLEDKKAPLYTCITKLANNGDTQCISFINQITILRKFAAALPICKLIRKIYNETEYLNIALAMENGSRRYANLTLFLDYADSFDKEKANGLSSFIRFIDSINEKGIEVSSANDMSPNANVVQIMSIHKSKGLEFPYCILANCSKKFNKQSLINNMILHPKLGVGMTRRNTKNMNEFETIMHLATKLSVEQDELSEEMRVLYVAMSRAREKLICTITGDKLDKKINTLSNNLSYDTSIPSFAIKSCFSFGDWILSASLRHPDAVALRNMISCSTIDTLKCETGALFKVFNEFDDEINNEVNEITTEVDKSLKSEIKSRCDFRYKYNDLRNIPTKCAASHRDIDSLDKNYFANKVPSFMSKSGLSPAQKGTALHKFMQYAIYENACNDSNAELERLHKLGFLTDEESNSIKLEKVDKFFSSNLYERINNSNNVMREKKFAVNVSANDIDNQLSKDFKDEKVLIQGIADCAFVEDNKLVIVDYKTDNIKSPETLLENYSDQLKIYCNALSLCTGLEVKQALLYSFALGKSIEVL